MITHTHPPRRLQALIITTVLAGVYYLGGRLGLLFAFQNVYVAPVWPPAGIALAALLLLGRAALPGLALGACATAFVNSIASGIPYLTAASISIVIAAGNTLEAWVGAALLRSAGGDGRDFERPADVFRFTALAGLLATTIGATIGVAGLCLHNLAQWPQFGFLWWTWWLGDAFGVLVIAPAILCLARWRPGRLHAGRSAEAALFFALLAGFGWLIFGGMAPLEAHHYPLAHLLLPLCFWPAFRLGRAGSALTALILSGYALWGTARGHGPFALPSPDASLLLLQSYLGVIAVTTLAVAATVHHGHQIELALRNARDELDERVRARTADLQAANRQLQEINANQNRFFSIIAHDLRSPFHGLKLLGQLLTTRRAALNAADLERVTREVEREARGVERLLENLLEWARVQMNRVEFAPTRVDLAAAAADALTSARPYATLKQQTLANETPAGLEAQGDPRMIATILRNLLANAIKYTPAGGCVTVAARRAAGGVEIEVRDNGIGLPPEMLTSLFQMGAQVIRPGTEQEQGSGLGLILCRQLAERHGGGIRAESTPGQGSRFIVSLPDKGG